MNTKQRSFLHLLVRRITTARVPDLRESLFQFPFPWPIQLYFSLSLHYPKDLSHCLKKRSIAKHQPPSSPQDRAPNLSSSIFLFNDFPPFWEWLRGVNLSVTLIHLLFRQKVYSKIQPLSTSKVSHPIYLHCPTPPPLSWESLKTTGNCRLHLVITEISNGTVCLSLSLSLSPLSLLLFLNEVQIHSVQFGDNKGKQ